MLVSEPEIPDNPVAVGVDKIVQDPEGKPFNTTLPVVEEQVIFVMVPTVGVEGKGFTIIVPVAFTILVQDPINGIL